MSLQQPGALWLLALLPLIVLLYILRSQRTQARVTTMRFWRRLSSDLEGRPARRLPIREPLMWLQMLVIALLATALAGPFTPGGERTHHIVVLDRSASMLAQAEGRTRLATAKSLIVEQIARLGADDTVSLVTIGQKPELVGTWSASSASDASAAVAAVTPFLGEVDPLGALALASEIARREANAKPRIALHTDASSGTIEAYRLGTVPADLTVEMIGSPAADIALTSVVTRQSPSGRGRSTALVTLSNSGAEARSANLRVTADGIDLGAQPISIPGASTASAVFTLPLGSQIVEAAVDPTDGYALDDRAFATASAPRQGEIRLVAANPVFWERALGGIPGFKVSAVRPAMFRPADASLHVFDGFVPSDPQMPRTPVLIANPPEARLTDSATQAVRGAAPPAVSVVSRVDPASPLVRSADLIGLSVSSGGLRAVPPWASVAASTRAGPVLVYGVNNGVRTVVMAFDPTKAGLDREIAFPVLVANAVGWLIGEQASAELPIGATKQYSPSANAREVIVRLPSGRAIAYAVRGQPVSLGELSEPGAYALVERDQTGVIRSETFVTNLPASERLGASSNVTVLTGLVAQPPVGEVGAASLWWPLLAAAALGVAMVEWVLYSLGGR